MYYDAMEESKISGYCRWLDVKTATLYRTIVWEIEKGDVLNLLYKRYMDPDMKFVCIQECRVKMLLGNAEIRIESFVDNNVRISGYEKFIEKSVGELDGVIYSDVTTNNGHRVVTASRMVSGKARSYIAKREERKISPRLCLD